jgi:O-antigen/teichoic acid export membrane protein
LGAEGLGQYSFIFAFVGIFFIFGDFGLSQLLIKDLSKDDSDIDKFMSNVLSLKLVLLVICFLVYFIILFFIGKNEIFLALVLAGLAQILVSLRVPFFNLSRVKHKGKIVSIATIMERILTLIFSFYTIVIMKDLILFVFGFLIAQLIRTVWLYLVNKKYFKFKFGIDKKYVWGLLKKSYPFVLIASFAFVYIRIDTIILSFMQGDVITGYYNAAYKLINVFNIVPAVLLTFGFPMFSKLFHHNKVQAKKLLEKILQYALYLIFPIIIGVFLVGDRVLEFVYGFGSIESFIAFKILIIAELFVFLTTIFGQFIASTDRQLIFAKIAGIGALVNIILNIILIPAYSLYGAGVATAITYFVMFVMMLYYIKKKLLNFKFFKYLIMPAIATFLMYLILINILQLHLLLIVAICAVVYGAIIFIYKYMRR